MVAAAHDTFDYIGLGAALLVGSATLAAAGVALFGPRWERRHREPRLSVTVDGGDVGGSIDHERHVDVVTELRIDNARGRARADDVEVYIDASWEFEPSAALPLAEQEPLPYGDPRTTPAPPTSQSVAAGFSRWVPLVLAGDPTLLAEECGLPVDRVPRTSIGALAIARLANFPAWLLVDQEYTISITVTGGNLDALHYAGKLVLEEADFDGGEEIMHTTEVRWTEPLRRVHSPEPPSRIAAVP
jgi:hypothetical protein